MADKRRRQGATRSRIWDSDPEPDWDGGVGGCGRE